MFGNQEVKPVEQSIDEFVAGLEDKKIKLWAEGDSLRYKAPAGVITKEVLKSLSDKKAAILDYLKYKDAGGIFSIPISKAGEKECYPLSAAQMRMFLLNRLDDSSTAYNLTQVLKIKGEIDKERLHAVLRQLAARHEALRTSFEMADGRPVQRIHDDVDFEVDYQEADAADENIAGIIKDFIKPYDLSKAPLFRFKLVKLIGTDGKPSYILIQDMHHIISDGVSEGLLVREVNGLFSGKRLPDQRIQYKDYAEWHEKLLKSSGIQRQKQYWLERLKPEIPLLNLPTDHARPPIFSFEGSSLKFRIGRGMVCKLHNLARENRVTLFTLLLAAYAILLERYTGQDDIMIGTPVAGRRHADILNTIGVFINTLALRISYAPESSFAEFLKSLGQDVLQAFDNQDYPFANLVDDIVVKRDMSRNPVFDTMFILQNMDVDEIKVEGLEISGYEFDKGMAQFDITLIATEIKDEIEIELNYCTSLFSEDTIRRFGAHYINILAYMSEHPEVRLREIDMLSDAEKHQLLYEFNNTTVPYPKEKLVHSLFEEQVRRTPGNVALVLRDRQVTYKKLNDMANCIANKLREKGADRNSIVGILANRSFEMLAGIIGILKSGGAYLPIDPGYPEDRINYMIEDSETRVLLTMSHLKCKIGFDGETVFLDELDYADSPAVDPEIINRPEDLAYMIYTSGSTGKPKAVMISHRALNNFIRGMTDKIEFRQEKSILALTTVCFDIFALETHLPLTCGMKVVIADENQQMDSKLLYDLITEHNIDMLQMTPSRMKLLLSNKNSANCLNKVTDIIVGGEMLSDNLLKEISSITKARIFNAYGPTETTVWSALKELSGSEQVNIGRPIANTQIYILGSTNRLQPVNVTGELCIGGDGLARGYWKREDLTKEKFITNPHTNSRIYKTGDLACWTADGELKLAGRMDHQVKIRGYRVELEEIEKQLMGYTGMEDCVVTAREDSLGNKYIAAYYVSAGEQNVGQMRAFLSGTLPEYMVPGTYTRLEQFPRTANGKIDRKSLPEPVLVRQSLGNEFIEAKTRSEKVLEDIWKSLLGTDQIGIHDNFFDAGGNSLLLVQMHAKIEEKFPGKISVARIFAYPTISKLAGFLDEDCTLSMDERKAASTALQDAMESGACGKAPVKDIAIIGMHGVFAGAEDFDEYWEALRTGKDCTREIPANRRTDLENILASAGAADQKRNPEYMRCGYMKEIDKFDYSFFNISPREASFMDPNQRLFLQTAWKAAEDSGYGGGLLRGSKTGVYVGYSSDFGKEYKDIIRLTGEDPAAQLVPGNIKSIIAGRIAYLMDLKGPCITVDTACSSALAAVHLACSGIRNGECTMALAGSVKISLTPFDTDRESRTGAGLSNGKARVFDEASDGTGFGEGVAAVLLKPLDEAVHDRDHIYAVIKGSAMNQDGASVGLTAPNSAAQEELILQAWDNAGVDPLTISYIEANGTGTKLGDSIEIEAITGAFRKYTNRKQFCAIGSVKGNMGHLDHTAGMARLIKAVLSLKNSMIPPTLHFENPNTMIDFTGSPVYVNDKPEKWETAGFPKRCGVSAFGLSGTNCHIILEEPPLGMPAREDKASPEVNILSMSAKSKATLKEIVRQYKAFLGKNEKIDLRDVCHTANTGRGHYNFRLAVMFKRRDDLTDKIETLISSDLDIRNHNSIHTGEFKIISGQHCMGKMGELTQEDVKKLNQEVNIILKRMEEEPDNEVLHGALCGLYVKGADIDWNKLYTGKGSKRVSLPTYPFERKRCWIEPVIDESGYRPNELNCSANRSRIMNVRLEGRDDGRYTVTEMKISSIWGELLGLDVINIRDDFFMLGGNSLIALRFEAEMEKKQLKVDHSMVYTYPTIIGLAEYLDKNDKHPDTDSGQMINSTAAMIAGANMDCREKGIELENIEPFNDIIYKGCFYSAYLPVVNLYGIPVLAVLVNEVSTYKLLDDGKTKILNIDYLPGKPFYALSESMGIKAYVRHKSGDIINDTLTALRGNRPVIVCVDLYHVSIRPDMYNKTHEPHCLLIYGFEETGQVFRILEHRHSGSLVYEKRTLRYADLEKSYAGYLDHFNKLDIIKSNLYNLEYINDKEAPSFFEFDRIGQNNTVTDMDVLGVFSVNLKCQEKKVQEGLECLKAFSPEFAKVILDEQKAVKNAENIIVFLSEVILSKQAEYYRNSKLLEHRPELHEALNQSLVYWNFIRANIGKMHYTSKYRRGNMEDCAEKLNSIYQLEKSYYENLYSILNSK
ncbi:MAG: amino acid adenylation domain-containing protein [Clostridiaceae bacterium]